MTWIREHKLAVGAVPYTTADEQMRAVLNTVFPYENSPEPGGGADYRAGPFGEVFDAITLLAVLEHVPV